MADEVIIMELTRPRTGDASSVGGRIVTTQVLDIGVQSAQFNAATEVVIVQSNAVDFWFKHGDSTVSAAANTDGNVFLPADMSSLPLPVSPGLDYIDTAAAV